ncbi:hypothetical protein Pmani_024678 [Petrolisthes manimaculis]|uniref:Uncharacterized protein n=1 Tax=Petrolisthes manimaculis TaxID=1843537 RepID=A0AAE1P876_9EUCA|nr:hypothetical protein Pmani_024678 [Petrolisthes manimaculis]
MPDVRRGYLISSSPPHAKVQSVKGLHNRNHYQTTTSLFVPGETRYITSSVTPLPLLAPSAATPLGPRRRIHSTARPVSARGQLQE